ncbi:MAG TPA: protein YgfX [Cellvibrionaceae bacterium]
MRKRNLKLAVTLSPSWVYLQALLILHALTSIASLSLHLSFGYHALCLGMVAASLCYQLNIYWGHSTVRHIVLDGHSILLNRIAAPHIEPQHRMNHKLYEAVDAYSKTQDEIGKLLPKAWVLPGLLVFYFQPQQGGKKTLPIFFDAVSSDDFRKLRIFTLRGPLLQKDSPEHGPLNSN